MTADGVPCREKSVLITGVGGRIGRAVWATLGAAYCDVRGVDIRPTAGLEGDIVQADLTDLSAAIQVADGVDAIVHLAGIPDEAPFDDLVQANIVATFNVLEAARQTHVSRVVLASSNHVVGFYPRTTRVGPHDPVRPDSLYAVTKSFGETLGRLYHDKYGLQVVCLRIGSFRQQPQNKRQLSTWLSPGDATRLLCRSIDAEDVGFAVVFGCSRVHPSWWDNPDAVQIGWEPIDDVGAYEMSLETQTEEAGIGSVVQGGFFADPAYRGGLG